MDLKALVSGLPVGDSENLLVGFDSSDDAAVYRLSDDTAIVQTADYITPMTDDPFLFGELAAANALSDIYAMGARPITAINLCNFPGSGIPYETLREILEGGSSKIREAGAVLVGGHTIKDDDLKYGLSVNGIVHPDKVITNGGAKAGDLLVLTKPIGTGILYNGVKNGALDSTYLDAAIRRNAVLNRSASELMLRHGAEACTDVTGFGLLGHLKEMAESSGVSAVVRMSDIPLFEKALETSEKGFKPGMSKENIASLNGLVEFDEALTEAERWLLVDPQTSGGLLIAIPNDHAESLLMELRGEDCPEASIIGEIVEPAEPLISAKV